MRWVSMINVGVLALNTVGITVGTSPLLLVPLVPPGGTKDFSCNGSWNRIDWFCSFHSSNPRSPRSPRRLSEKLLYPYIVWTYQS